MDEIELKTAPADFRFPTTNQTRHCFTRYIEFHRCVAAKGEESGECGKFSKYYRALCPGEWKCEQSQPLYIKRFEMSYNEQQKMIREHVEKWNEQRENGNFPGPL